MLTTFPYHHRFRYTEMAPGANAKDDKLRKSYAELEIYVLRIVAW
jgi:hypothetical protein